MAFQSISGVVRISLRSSSCYSHSWKVYIILQESHEVLMRWKHFKYVPLIKKLGLFLRLHLMPEGKHNLHLRFANEFNKLAEDFLQWNYRKSLVSGWFCIEGSCPCLLLGCSNMPALLLSSVHRPPGFPHSPWYNWVQAGKNSTPESGCSFNGYKKWILAFEMLDCEFLSLS